MDNNAGLAFLFFVFIIIIIWFFSMSGSVRERKFMFREGLESKKPFWEISNQPWIKCLRENNCTQKDLREQVKYYSTGNKYADSGCKGYMANPLKIVKNNKLIKNPECKYQVSFCPGKDKDAKSCIMFNELTVPGKFNSNTTCGFPPPSLGGGGNMSNDSLKKINQFYKYVYFNKDKKKYTSEQKNKIINDDYNNFFDKQLYVNGCPQEEGE